MTRDGLAAWAAGKGLRLEVLDLSSLEAVRDRLSRLRDEGLLDAAFFQKSLSGFKYLEGCPVETPRSVIVAAMPRPAHTLGILVDPASDLAASPGRDVGDARDARDARDGAQVTLVLPPTYANYASTAVGVLACLKSDFGLSDRQIERASAPLKSLAALSGLTRYGRNNICYAEGLGSYIQLMAFVTSVEVGGKNPPSTESTLMENQRLARCSGCRACVSACPAGAIDPERFLIHAERCYTLFSEEMSPIPESVPTPSPQCLVGCMKCQEACPENKGLLRHESTGIIFDREESRAMLEDPEGKDVRTWKGIREKLAPLGVSDDAALYARNIRRGMLHPRPR